MKVSILLLIAAFFCGGVKAQHARFAAAVTIDSATNDFSSSEVSWRPLADVLQAGRAAKFELGKTEEGRSIEVYYFPGRSTYRAVVMAGVHGSELSSIDVAMMVVKQLQAGAAPYYSVIVVPCVFPDNAGKAIGNGQPQTNFGRYSSAVHPDPNRQMPLPGQAFDESHPVDARGREIEPENQMLLRLLQEFRPQRVANLHAIRDTTRSGIFADPRTDCNGRALGFETDEALALTMAGFISENGGRVPGNKLSSSPSALYYKDPFPAPAGALQARNLTGSTLNDGRGSGISLGTWASTAVCEGEGERSAMRLFTVEFPGYAAHRQYKTDASAQDCFLNIYLYATALTGIFLQDYFPE